MADTKHTDGGGVFGRFPNMIVVAGLSAYALNHFGPVFKETPFASDPNWYSFFAAGVLCAAILTIIGDSCVLIANGLELQSHRTASGHKGQSRFAELVEVEKDLTADGSGPVWGAVDGRVIASEVSSNGLVLGPPGTKKSVGMILPTIWNIRGPKVVLDFKFELAPVIGPALIKRGERVIVLNMGNKTKDQIGEDATYDPVNTIADNFLTPGNLRDVSSDVSEMAHQISPEPAGGAGQNQYFDIGQRDLIGFGITTETLIQGHGASLGGVASLLHSRSQLYKTALWACGRLRTNPDRATREPETPGPTEVDDAKGDTPSYARMEFDNSPWFDLHPTEDRDDFIRNYRDMSAKVVDLFESKDGKAIDSFLTGSQQAIKDFNCSTRAFSLTRSSSFRFSELKESEQPITVFIVADPARMTAQKKVLSLIQKCMYTEFLRHPNTHRKVYVISDETANFKIHDLI